MGSKKSWNLPSEGGWMPKQIYDKHSRAVALEVGDMVLIHVTAFKGYNKI